MKKEEVHASYLDQVKQQHAKKPLRGTGHKAFVVGAEAFNIGLAIVRRFMSSLVFDVVEEAPARGLLDVTDVDSIEDFFEGNMDWDTMVLSHGVTHMDWIEDVDDMDLRETINVNLIGTIQMVRAFVRATIDKPYRKRIIIIGSMAHRAVLNASSVYCASKAGVAHFVRCMGWELTPKGFDTFCVHPSNTEGTPMTDRTIKEIMRYRNIDRQAAEEYWGSINLMPRWLLPQDIGEVCYWLATNESASFLSGTQIELPGGQR